MSAILDIIGDALVKAQLSWMAEHGLAGKSVSLTNHRYTAGVLEALHAAGFRIVGPDDVAQLERIAKGDIPGVWQEKFEKAQKIARAIGRNNDEADGR